MIKTDKANKRRATKTVITARTKINKQKTTTMKAHLGTREERRGEKRREEKRRRKRREKKKKRELEKL